MRVKYVWSASVPLTRHDISPRTKPPPNVFLDPNRPERLGGIHRPSPPGSAPNHAPSDFRPAQLGSQFKSGQESISEHSAKAARGRKSKFINNHHGTELVLKFSRRERHAVGAASMLGYLASSVSALRHMLTSDLDVAA